MAIGKYCQLCGQDLKATECIAEVHGVVMTSPCMFDKVYGEKTASRDETRAMVRFCAGCAAELPKPLPERCPKCDAAVFGEVGRAAGAAAGVRPGLWQRGVAFAIDLALIALLTWGGAEALAYLQVKMLPPDFEAAGLAELSILSFFFAFIGYHTLFTAGLGRTPGKFAIGYRILLSNGGRDIGLFRSLVRSSLYLLILYVLPLGFILLLFQEPRSRWLAIVEEKALFHNDLTDTIVVKAQFQVKSMAK